MPALPIAPPRPEASARFTVVEQPFCVEPRLALEVILSMAESDQFVNGMVLAERINAAPHVMPDALGALMKI